jgi:hypothetical protein
LSVGKEKCRKEDIGTEEIKDRKKGKKYVENEENEELNVKIT